MGPKHVFYLIAATGVVAHCLHLSTQEGPRCKSSCVYMGVVPAPLTEKDISPKTIVIIGSNVAVGAGSGDGHKPWATQLAELVQERSPDTIIVNDAVFNFSLQQSKDRWANQPALEKASAVIISLNLGIAELSNLTTQQQKEYRDSWLSELKSFADTFHVPVFLGGVLPYGRSAQDPPEPMEVLLQTVRQEQPPYIEEHLLECNRIMKTWKYPLFDFLSATDDGTGAWKPGLMKPNNGADYKPNDAGHKAMVEAITPKQIDMLAGLK